MFKFKVISIIILVFAIIIFVIYNMQTIEVNFPIIKPMQIKVISLLLIGFLLGNATVLTIIMLDRNNKKKSSKKTMEQR